MERQQLQLVREALKRLDRDEYGECLQCGVEIPMKRLEVAPWVRYCIQCQELEDQGLLPQHPVVGFDDDDDETSGNDEDQEDLDEDGEEDKEEDSEDEDSDQDEPAGLLDADDDDDDED
jgi:hypothetical protein